MEKTSGNGEAHSITRDPSSSNHAIHDSLFETFFPFERVADKKEIVDIKRIESIMGRFNAIGYKKLIILEMQLIALSKTSH